MNPGYYERGQVDAPVMVTATAGDNLMEQLEVTRKMALHLCEQVDGLTARLSPVCAPEGSMPVIKGEGLLGGREPSPAVQSIFALKETLARCQRQIVSVQERLAL